MDNAKIYTLAEGKLKHTACNYPKQKGCLQALSNKCRTGRIPKTAVELVKGTLETTFNESGAGGGRRGKGGRGGGEGRGLCGGGEREGGGGWGGAGRVCEYMLLLVCRFNIDHNSKISLLTHLIREYVCVTHL